MPSKVVVDSGQRLDPICDPALGTRLASTYRLTRREIDVALLLVEGRSNAAIAAGLAISEHTARHHTRHVLAKLGVHSRAAVPAVVSRAVLIGGQK